MWSSTVLIVFLVLVLLYVATIVPRWLACLQRRRHDQWMEQMRAEMGPEFDTIMRAMGDRFPR